MLDLLSSWYTVLETEALHGVQPCAVRSCAGAHAHGVGAAGVWFTRTERCVACSGCLKKEGAAK